MRRLGDTPYGMVVGCVAQPRTRLMFSDGLIFQMARNACVA
ncbi:hypothetical protein [Kingella potus]|nr:hypothetical protein [Kingella potus]